MSTTIHGITKPLTPEQLDAMGQRCKLRFVNADWAGNLAMARQRAKAAAKVTTAPCVAIVDKGRQGIAIVVGRRR